LAQKLILKTAEKVVFKSLPVLPQALTLKADKVTNNDDQQKALAHIHSQIDSGEFGVTALHGVTDSLYRKFITPAQSLAKLTYPSYLKSCYPFLAFTASVAHGKAVSVQVYSK